MPATGIAKFVVEIECDADDGTASKARKNTGKQPVRSEPSKFRRYPPSWCQGQLATVTKFPFGNSGKYVRAMFLSFAKAEGCDPCACGCTARVGSAGLA